MDKNTSKQSPVASDAILLKSPDKKNIKLENIHQSNTSSCAITGVHDFITLNKQKAQQHTDLNKLGKIYFTNLF